MKKKKLLWLLVLICLWSVNSGSSWADTFQTDYVPWSGYWWPFTQGGLVTGSGYNGRPAPLEKYDLAVHGTLMGPSVRYGWEVYYNKDAERWHGLCFNWAAAAAMEPEPVHRGIYNGVVFNVGDKKGLLTVAYHGALYDMIDMSSPIDFHAVLERNIRENNTAVLMDLGVRGVEVWFYPVYKYDTTYTQSGNTRHYTTTIYYPTDDVRPDYVGALIHSATFQYMFVLNDNGIIISGQWEGRSVTNPPVNAAEVYGTNPVNPGIDYDQVVKIAQTNDDPYEENNSFERAFNISSGSYELLAIDPDYFAVFMKAGDELSVQVVSEENPVTLQISDPWLTSLDFFQVDGRLDFKVTADTDGIHYLAFESATAGTEPFYTLSVLHKLPFTGIFPVNGGMGLALLNPDSALERVIISQISRDGIPFLSKTFNFSGWQTVGMLQETYRHDSIDTSGYIRIDSDYPLTGLETVTNYSFRYAGANMMPVSQAGTALYFPAYSAADMNTAIGIINVSDKSETIKIHFYSDEGESRGFEQITMSPGEKLIYEFNKIRRQSLIVKSVSGNPCLQGYYDISESILFSNKQRAIVPVLPELQPTLIIPHVAEIDGWYTKIAIMNAGASAASVSFTAYSEAGEVMEITKQTFAGNQAVTYSIPEIFPEISKTDIAAVRIESSLPTLSGYSLYGKDNQTQLAGIPLAYASSSYLILPHIACSDIWETGIGIFYAGVSADDVYFSLHDVKGEVVEQAMVRLNPNERIAVTITDLFGGAVPAAARYLEINSVGGQPLIGLYKMWSVHHDRYLWGDVLK